MYKSHTDVQHQALYTCKVKPHYLEVDGTLSIQDIKGKIVVGLINHYGIYIVFEESVFKIPKFNYITFEWQQVY